MIHGIGPGWVSNTSKLALLSGVKTIMWGGLPTGPPPWSM